MPAPNMNDWELLQAYAARRSERAFELLVSRYLDLVYSSALRQVRDPHLAEEVSQAVFVILSRKAGRISRATLLPGWLFRTTRFVAAKAVRGEIRRRWRERKASEMQPDTTSAEKWNNLEPLLDEAVAHLSAKDRDAVLLRYFQGKGLKEVGLSLGTSEDAAKKRVTRAVEKLRAFFTGRGFTLSAAFLAGALSTEAVKAAPAELAGAVISAAQIGGAALTGSLASLLDEALHELAWAKMRFVARLSGGLLLTTLLVTVALRTVGSATRNHAGATNNSNLAAAVSDNPARNKPALVGQLKRNPATTKLRLRVVSANDGSGLAGAQIIAAFWRDQPTTIDLSTDGNGQCEVPLGVELFDPLRLWISANGYVPKVMDWHDYELATQTEEYVIRLDRGWAVSGRVKDEFGHPVARAKLQVSSPGNHSGQRENVGYHPRMGFVLSDDQGEWSFHQAPRNADVVTFFVTHPEFARLRAMVALTGPETQNILLSLEPGVSFPGVVVTTNDVPISNASVEEIDSFGAEGISGRTDIAGRFFFPHVSPAPIKLQIEADGYATLTRTVAPLTNHAEVKLVLADASPSSQPTLAGLPGRSKFVRLTGNVVDDQTGQPLPRFEVLIDERRGTLPKFVGEGRDGSFDWKYSRLSFAEYALEVQADGYMPETSLPTKVNAGEQPFEFRLTKHAGIAGRVLLPDGQPAANAEVFLGGKGFGPAMVTNPARGGFLQPSTGDSDKDKQAKTDQEGKFRFKPTRWADRVVVSHAQGGAAVSLSDLAAGPIVLQPWGRIEGILAPGNYELEIRLTESLADPLSNDRYMAGGREIGALKAPVTIPEAPADRGDEPFDLGTLMVEMKSESRSRK